MRSTVRAAGGLLWRERDGVTEVALVHRPKYQDWSLPKGKLTDGEHPLAAACREVAEETGVTPVLGVRLPTVNYPVLTSQGAADKTVDYWSMRAGAEGELTATKEVDQLKWVPLDDAGEALSYRRDADVVAAFAKLPRDVRTVVLVQHATPVAEGWDGPEVTRPLGEPGEQAALRLAELLAWYVPGRVLSATARRCVQTVEPLASRLELEIGSDSVFDAESHARSPEVTAERLATLTSGDEDPVVVCCERGVIPDTVALLADSDDLALPNVRTSDGTAWALSFTGDTLVAADHLDPGAVG
ncbi:MAG: NUDIX domain-containing protein [Micromonosporaceae bacterium]